MLLSRRPRATLAGVLLASIATQPAGAVANDPFAAAAPVTPAAAPRAEASHDPGPEGSLAYDVPIDVPPGRAGMAPRLGLHYSSSGALRGGVAVGWTLPLPSIERDLAISDAVVYTADLGGERSHLVPIVDAALPGEQYRAEDDAAQARFERVPGVDVTTSTWTATLPDGRRFDFTGSAAAPFAPTRWRVQRQLDADGNRIDYTWTHVISGGFDEWVVTRIEYGTNAGAGVIAHARVDFSYAPIETCAPSAVPIGAALDHRQSLGQLRGARRLTTITTTVRDTPSAAWRAVRQVSLGYDAAQLTCGAARAPLRYLTQLDETAYAPTGAATVRPPRRFTYGPAAPTFSELRTLGPLTALDRGGDRGATQMVRDMDGDALPDLVWIETAQRCTLHTRKGVYGGGFAAQEIVDPLPSIAWLDPQPDLQFEVCTLGGQFARRPVTDPNNPGCKLNYARLAYDFVDWDGDHKVDLLTQTWMSNWFQPVGGDFDAQGYTGGTAVPFMAGGGSDPPTCPVAEPTAQKDVHATDVWHVFFNDADRMSRTYEGPLLAELSLVPGGPETALDDTGGQANLPRLVDLDDDGRLDLVTPPLDAADEPVGNGAFGTVTGMWLWRGLGADGFAVRETWPTPVYDQTGIGGGFTAPTTGPLPNHFASTLGLTTADFDGDGAVDVIGDNAATSPSALSVAWNRGRAFTAPTAIGASGPLLAWMADLAGGVNGSPLANGARIATRQLVDLDADGLPDLLDTTPVAGDVTLQAGVTGRHNLGDALAPATALSSVWWYGNQYLTATSSAWQRRYGALDLTGDGVIDLAIVGTDGVLRAVTEPANQPLRLLRAIDDGQGAITTVTYAPSTDPTVMDPSAGTLAAARWLVQSVTVAPGAGQPPMVTEYRYAGPVEGLTSTYDRTRAFIGFTTMTVDTGVTAGSERARTVHTSTQVGGRMRPSAAWTYAVGAGGALTPLRHVAHTWTSAPVYGGPARFAYQATTIEHHCGTGATEASCLADSAAARTTGTQYAPYPATGTAKAYVRQLAVEALATDVTRREVRSYAVDLAAAHYRIDVVTEEVQRAVSTPIVLGPPITTLTTLARTRYDLDSRGHRLQTRVSTSDTDELVTVRTFDAAGNEWTVRRPGQALVSTTDHDAFELYPATVTNEAGHVVKTQYDVGTGVLVRREGPASRTYAPCTGCANVTVYAPETWTIDGRGRVLSHAVAAEPASGGGYATVVVDEHVYDDAALPTKITHRTKVDWAGTLIGSTEERTDGLGRLVSRIAPGTTTVANVTSYRYSAAGHLAAIDQQDPRRDTAAYVTTSYQSDALGRRTQEARPDGSVVTTTYDHDDSLVTESAPLDGTGARTRYLRDARDRVVQVDQYDLPTAGLHAITRTTYDELDRPVTIVDADGTTTSLTHDWAGRRTAVTRGTRTWRFGYDGDGNLTSRQAPLPTTLTDPALYTSRWAYDVLGRVLTHTVATRGMSAARLTELGLGTTTYAYDTGVNATGKLTKVTLPRGIYDYTYDVHGQLNWEQRQLTMPAGAGTVTPRQSVFRSYTTDGQLTAEKWEDGSQWSVGYDVRALPYKVSWLDPTAARWMAVANTYRGILGQQRSRDGSTYDQRRTWMYDALGRVVGDRIWKVSTNVTWAQRDYGYDGLGELRGVAGTIDGQVADATFSYDAGHRLIDATGPMAYTARFTYSGAGNVTRATINGGDTGTRDVRYQYGLRDPQAVDALLDYASGAQRATVSYDPSGNAVQRVNATGTYTQTWDGDDALREVVGPTGTERYYYDHTGARIGAVGPDGVKFWFGSNETRFTAAGVQTTRWLHLAYGDVVGRVENKTSLELQYVDALQNLILTTSPTGTITGSFLYGAFGEVVASRGAATHRRQFNGKENDLASGLRYYGARYYDPLLLRWTAADPLYQAVPEFAAMEPQRGNWYAFTVNNPVRYYDPDGRDAKPKVEKDQAQADAPPKTTERPSLNDEVEENPAKADAYRKGVVAEYALSQGLALMAQAATVVDAAAAKVAQAATAADAPTATGAPPAKDQSTTMPTVVPVGTGPAPATPVRASQSRRRETGSGQATGRRQHSPVMLRKRIDKSQVSDEPSAP